MSRLPRLIPVIDLLQGQVVRGKGGDRASYRPIVSALCQSSDPLAVALKLAAHCASNQLYIADLDALMGGVAQQELLQSLLQAMPDLELWLDAGFTDAHTAANLLTNLGEAAQRVVPIFASESLRSREALQACFTPSGPARGQGALSLDRRGSERLDPAGCWDAPELWPQRVIVMTLERVGSGAGPDLETMLDLRAKVARGTMLIGAGGVRSEDDLVRAGEAGADAWLVASALHDLQIPDLAPSPNHATPHSSD